MKNGRCKLAVTHEESRRSYEKPNLFYTQRPQRPSSLMYPAYEISQRLECYQIRINPNARLGNTHEESESYLIWYQLERDLARISLQILNELPETGWTSQSSSRSVFHLLLHSICCALRLYHVSSRYVYGRNVLVHFISLRLCCISGAPQMVFFEESRRAWPFRLFVRTISGRDQILGHTKSYSSCRPFKQCLSHIPHVR